MVNTQNTGNQGGMGQQKFVSRVEMAIMQFVILNKAKQGGVTRENLQQVFRGGNLQMQGDHLNHCIQQLVQEGHLKEEGNRYTITDDGREDVQKLQNLVLEVPNVIGGGVQGGQQKQGISQQQAVGGGARGTPGNVGAGGSTQGYTGQTTGNQGNFGTSNRGASESGEDLNRGSVNKGGATSPSGQKGNVGGQSR
jgi:predicted transcriptional regulator